MVARALGIAAHDVVVECRRMGGGFGGKETQMSLFACLAAILARRTGRAVKFRVDRDDDMIMTGKRHAFRYGYDVGFDDDGRILGLDLTLASRCGFSADLSGPINDRAMFHADNCYWLPNVALHSYRCRTNTVSDTAFRGFGGPQGMFAIEYVLDDIAHALGRDPLDVRRVNLYGTAERNVTPYGMTVEDNIAPEIIDCVATTSRYRERRAAIARMESRRSRSSAAASRSRRSSSGFHSRRRTTTRPARCCTSTTTAPCCSITAAPRWARACSPRWRRSSRRSWAMRAARSPRQRVRHEQGAERGADRRVVRQRFERHGGARCGAQAARPSRRFRRARSSAPRPKSVGLRRWTRSAAAARTLAFAELARLAHTSRACRCRPPASTRRRRSTTTARRCTAGRSSISRTARRCPRWRSTR